METMLSGRNGYGLDRGEAPRSLRVAVVYENLAAGQEARALVDYLMTELANDCRWVQGAWRFDLLGLGPFAAAAAREVSQAEILIVAAQQATLPEPVLQWLAQVLPRCKPGAMLIGLFDHHATATSAELPIQFQLQQLARSRGLAYISRALEMSSTAPPPPPKVELAPTATAGASPALPTLPLTGPRGEGVGGSHEADRRLQRWWSINE